VTGLAALNRKALSSLVVFWQTCKLLSYDKLQHKKADAQCTDGGTEMTTPREVTWQSILETQSPQLLKQITGLRETVLAEGALSIKTKALMMMLCDALLGHSDGVANIAKRARALRASDAEITETLAVAFLMGGMPSLVTAAHAFRD
jgi:alkylhydroperoxidase/carboxymuconolactone decarboxylase family protein YurZ